MNKYGVGSAYVQFCSKAATYSEDVEGFEVMSSIPIPTFVRDARDLFDLMEEMATCVDRSFYFN